MKTKQILLIIDYSGRIWSIRRDGDTVAYSDYRPSLYDFNNKIVVASEIRRFPEYEPYIHYSFGDDWGW